MRKTIRTCCWLLFINLLISKTAFAIEISDFVDFSLRSGGSTLLPGRLYIPPEAIGSSATPRPLIVFLHGGGGAGTDNMRQLNQDIADLAFEAERRGAFLYAPQAPLNWRPKSITDYVMTMVDRRWWITTLILRGCTCPDIPAAEAGRGTCLAVTPSGSLRRCPSPQYRLNRTSCRRTSSASLSPYSTPATIRSRP